MQDIIPGNMRSDCPNDRKLLQYIYYSPAAFLFSNGAIDKNTRFVQTRVMILIIA